LAEKSARFYVDVRLHSQNDDAANQELQNQLIGAFTQQLPWLGLLGISAEPSHLFNTSSSQPSLLQTLAHRKATSLYWGYTAGASYRSNMTASLTLRGYDAARVDMGTSLQVPFDSDTNRTFPVTMTGLTVSGNETTTNTTSGDAGLPLVAVLDSVIPEIWLPKVTCTLFEEALNITWNDAAQMYLVNDSQHENLVAASPTITFWLAASNSSTASYIDVSLPYAAFDLNVSYPLANITDNTSRRYLPLKRAANASQIFLGRTFLQEA
jgi:hypothetical protein